MLGRILEKYRNVLWVLLVSSILSLNTICLAQFGGGTGTEGDPWQIGRAYHLDEMREYLGSLHNDKYFIQTHNINLGVPPWNQGEGWEPIGDSEIYSFQGNFDGNGFMIEGLTVYRPRADYQGLFGYTIGVTFSNINLTNVNISGREGIGALIGWNEQGSTVVNCSSTGIIQGRLNIGGLLGYNGINSVVRDCYSSCRVTGSDARTAGLIGYHDYYSSLHNSFSTGDIYGYREIGGLVGRSAASATINDCYSTGNVTANVDVGGLVGRNGYGCIINNSYSTGNVVGNSNIGGLTGLATGGGMISNCFSIGRVTGNANSGGLIGKIENYDVHNSYWDMQTSTQNYSAGGHARTTEQMTYPYEGQTYQGWDFEEIWVNDELHRINNGYPFLSWQKANFPDIAVNPHPANRSTDISIDLESVSWSYIADTTFAEPLGFRVYMNTTGEFTLQDSCRWIDYDPAEEQFFCPDILPVLEYATTYYWVVIPTTIPEDNLKRNNTLDQKGTLIQRKNGLAPDHHYYRGDAVNPQVWLFTTERYPYPNIAFSPLPEDEAENVSVDLEGLIWRYSSNDTHIDPAGFKVYFNDIGEFTAEDPYNWVNFEEDRLIYYCDQTITEPLTGSATYYWMIVPATETGNIVENTSRIRSQAARKSPTNNVFSDAQNCPIWSFTTEASTTTELIYPHTVTKLYQNYPNPFNPETRINYSINDDSFIELRVINMKGQTIRILEQGIRNKGSYSVVWDGKDGNGSFVASGIYFYRLATETYEETKKMILIK